LEAAPITITVVFVTYNSARLLERVLASLAAALRGISFQCVVVDNASRDASVALLERHAGGYQLIRNRHNVGFARASNQALPHVRGKYVLLLNPDAVLPEDALRETLAFMEAHPRCGILGVKLLDADGALQPSCRYFPTPLNLFVQRAGLHRLFSRVRMADDLDWDHARVRACDWVPGCFYLVRRRLIDEVGLFDPRYFLYYEEVDHCRAAKRAGWEVVFFPRVSVMHVGGESARSQGALTEAGRQVPAFLVESELLYFRKHHGRAGVWRHALLTTAAAAIVACKRLVRRRSLGALRAQWLQTMLLWSTFQRTTWGTRPTR
jgi:N-acetylglucosaminyl-diphospho-decaprenol L-rhamnosyltransferase